MRLWMRRGGVVVLVGAALIVVLPGSLRGCGHNPNHDIDREAARAAANRVHPPPPPGVKMEPGAGG